MNDLLRDEIIQDITTAFAGVRRGPTTLHEAEVIDDHGSESERRAARIRDKDKRWEEVPDADIETQYSALSFLCLESFRYYLPAYMRWSLRHFRTSNSVSSDFTIYALVLSPNKDKSFNDWQLARFAMFSPPQAKAIRRYLEFMVEHGAGDADETEARRALKNYWSEGLKTPRLN